MNNKILIADDEAGIRRLIYSFLTKEGYEVIEADNGQKALENFYSNQDISLCILDVMMPSVDGYEVCKTIRQSSSVPIMMLTAKTQEEDQIKGFDAGADDYISKPFSLVVLSKKINALLKRVSVSNTDNASITLGELNINTDSHEVKVAGKKIDLTPKEYEVLTYLLKNSNIVVSRNQILKTVWHYEYCGDERTVDTHIKNLRVKLGKCGNMITTVRGYGYKVDK